MLWTTLRRKIASLARRSKVESEMADEMKFHLDARADDLIRRHGLSAEEARRKARLEFGSAEKYKEESRQARGVRWFDEWTGDLRYAFRSFRRTPGLTFAAVATLALGIGANTAVFSAVDAMLLRPLPVMNPDELVAFNALWPENAMVGRYSGSGRLDPATGRQKRTSFSELTFRHFRDHSETLSDVFAFSPTSFIVVDERTADAAQGLVVSGAYFKGFGVQASIGRTLGPEDDVAGAAPVAVLSHRYWRTRFQGDPNILGKAVTLNGVHFTIVGVLSEGFFGPRVSESSDVTIPLAVHARVPDSSTWWLQIMGRLKPGVTPSQVLAELQPGYERTVFESWNTRPAEQRRPNDAERTGIPEFRVIAGSQGPLGPPADAQRTLTLVFAIVVLILLIGCVNLANLFLARAASRQQETSTRLALGSGRGRLIRQLLTESLLLACCGGALGLLLAWWCKDFLLWFPTTDTLILTTHIDARVFFFSAALSVLVGVLFGLSPALRATKKELMLRLGSGGQKGTVPRALLRKSLLVAQVAVSLILLIIAGLFNMSLRNLGQSPIGFNTSSLLVFELRPTLQDTSEDRTLLFHRQISESIEAIPGVRSVTQSAILPLSDNVWDADVSAGNPPTVQNAYLHIVRANFFEAMEMPVLLGRAFAEADDRAAPRVAMINERLARAFSAHGRTVGLRLRLPDYIGKTEIEVVGVVRDAKYSTLSQPAPPTLYLPFNQRPQVPMAYEVRFAGAPAPIAAAVRQAVHRIDPNLPLIGFKTFEEQIRELIGRERMFATLSATFGLIGLLMAGLGLYGVVSFSAGRRTNEIGLRMALGARRVSVVSMIMQETLLLVGAGIAVGLTLPYLLRKWIIQHVDEFGNLLFGVTYNDTTTLLSGVVVMIAIAGIAAYLPARRAARVDPMTALRYE
jgi:predicted permease